MSASLRRFEQTAAIAISALVLTSCASMHVHSYLEPGASLTRYHTYNWASDDRLSTGDPRLDNNSFFLERFQSEVDKRLTAREFEKTTTTTPDVWLHYHASVDQRLDVNRADLQHSGCEDCTSSVYDVATLMIEFIDARTNRLVWRGWAEGNFDGAIDNQDWMEQRIDDAVARILTRLPRRLPPSLPSQSEREQPQ